MESFNRMFGHIERRFEPPELPYSLSDGSQAAEEKFQQGLRFYNGDDVAQDKREALRLWREVAERGHADAQFNLGVMYANGEGVSKNFAESLKWFRKAAEQEDGAACYEM